MRVLVLTTSFPLGAQSSAGSFVEESVRYLADKGVEISVLAPHHENVPKSDYNHGFKVFRFQYMWPSNLQSLCYGYGIPTNLKRSWFARFQLIPFFIVFLFSSILHARNADIIHCHWSLAGLVGIVLKVLSLHLLSLL